jgi:hypothetical protein
MIAVLLGPILGRQWLMRDGTVGRPVFSPLYAKGMMLAIQASSTMPQAITLARELNSAARQWVRSYPNSSDITRFRNDWMVARNILPLQVRLVVEQALYGDGLKDLVTGFKPL